MTKDKLQKKKFILAYSDRGVRVCDDRAEAQLVAVMMEQEPEAQSSHLNPKHKWRKQLEGWTFYQSLPAVTYFFWKAALLKLPQTVPPNGDQEQIVRPWAILSCSQFHIVTTYWTFNAASITIRLRKRG